MLEVFNRIADTSSPKQKQVLLEQYQSGCMLELIQVALDPRIRFFIQEIPEFIPNGTGEYTLQQALVDLRGLSDRTYTGHAGQAYLTRILERLTPEDAEVIRRVVIKDLRCGLGAKTVNKVFPDLVYTHPYQRCSSYSEKAVEKIPFPAYSQRKADGMYVDIINENGQVRYVTRAGLELDIVDAELHSAFMHQTNKVFQGEALVFDDYGRTLSREEGNGFLNSDELAEHSHRIYFVLWNTLTLDEFQDRYSPRKYSRRFNELDNFVNNEQHSDRVRLVENKVVNSIEEARAHFCEYLRAGEEGTILKSPKGIWKDHTSPDLVKMKLEIEVELEVTGINPGKGKHAGKVGSLPCKSACGKLEVGVGGLTDSDRAKYMDGSLTGKIITVRANDIQYKKDSPASLFLPRFVEVRHDKTEADSLERIEEIKRATIELGV